MFIFVLFVFFLQDADQERPLKRHGSQQSTSSSSSCGELSPATTIDSPPSVLQEDYLLPSSSSDEDDEKMVTAQFSDKTYLISSSSTVVAPVSCGHSAKLSTAFENDTNTTICKPVQMATRNVDKVTAVTNTNNLRCVNSDNNVYSSSSSLKENFSSNNKNSSKSITTINAAVASLTKHQHPFEASPADSSTSDDVTDSDFETVTNLDLVDIVNSPQTDDYNVFSPLDNNKHNTDRDMYLAKGDKTPHSANKKRPSLFYKTKVDDTNLPCYVTPTSEMRLCPLPMLPWANREAVWSNMCRKDERASLDRDINMFENHPGLQPRMRAILLDWLIEVCEVYKLHRETYYLTIDYLDRYLTLKTGISKNQLQLIGITCLFVASKVEEIYPPKLNEFAYVTDGACTEEDILKQEVLVLQALNWSITPVTIMGWVSIYMQLNETTGQTHSAGIDAKALLLLNSSKWSQSFIYPQFSGLDYSKTAQLIDLSSLDIGLANFPYSIIAAAAISHIIDK